VIRQTGLGWPTTYGADESARGLGWPVLLPAEAAAPSPAAEEEDGGVAPVEAVPAQQAPEPGPASDEKHPTDPPAPALGPADEDHGLPNATRTSDGIDAEPAGDATPAAGGAEAEVPRETASEDIPVSDLEQAPPLYAALEAERRAKASPLPPSLASAPLPVPAKTRILTVANQKGGVGKTTSTVNLAAALASQGLSVLVLDLDPQGNASTALGVDHRAEVPSIYDVLIEDRPLAEVAVPVADVPGLLCAPATIDLAGAEIELVSLVARESRLRRALERYLAHRTSDEGRLDYVLVDCPPSLGLLTVNALVAAREVLIPIQCEYYALEGLGQLLKNVELIQAHLNPTLHVSTILLTMYDGRTRLAAQVADEVRQHFAEQVLDTVIPRSVRISEAPSYGQTVLTYDPGSSGALAYLEAAREVARRATRQEESA